MNTSTRLAIKWIGIICTTALGLSLVGILAMVIFPSIKDAGAMSGLITIAQIASTGVIGLVGFLHPSPAVDPKLKEANLSLDSGTPQIQESK